MAYSTNPDCNAKRSAQRPAIRAATAIRRRSELVTFVGTLDGLLTYILDKWPESWPWELHQVKPCHDPRIVTIRRVWLTSVMAGLAEQWPEVRRALQSAGFLSPICN